MKRTIMFLMVVGAIVNLISFVTSIQAAENGDFAKGERVYKEICFACHRTKGDGKGPIGVNMIPRSQVFIDTNYMSRLTDQYMFDVIKYGKLSVLKREHSTTQQIVLMPAFENTFTDKQIHALITFVRSFLSGEPQSAESREIFNANCAVCHGAEGQGDGVMASPVQPAPSNFVSLIQPAPIDYTDPLLMARFNDDFLFWLIKKGRIGVTEEKGYETMNSFGPVLRDEEIWSVVHYIREHFIKKKTR